MEFRSSRRSKACCATEIRSWLPEIRCGTEFRRATPERRCGTEFRRVPPEFRRVPERRHGSRLEHRARRL